MGETPVRKSRSLSTKVTAIGGAIILIAVLQVAGGYWNSREYIQVLEAIDSGVSLHRENQIPLMKLAKEIQIDVIQVQQWLTDISATRGQDGLDDGMTVAAEYAAKFERDLSQAIGLAQAMGLTGMVSELESMRGTFASYYGMGKEMAAAYVKGGPALGNKIMGSFDGAAEAMTKGVENMLNDVAAVNSESSDMLSVQIRDSSQAAREFEIITLILGAAAVVVALAIAAFLSLRVVRPIVRMIDVMGRLADNDLAVEIPCRDRHDEIGRMAQAMQVYNTVLQQTMRNDQEAAEERAREEKRQTMSNLANEFENRVKGVVETVSAAAREMQMSAQSMSETAGQSSRQASAIAASSQQASANIQTVVAATEQLTSSISDISRQVKDSARIASEASAEAERTNTSVEELNAAAQKIGDVVELINDIASQTNLLALNATIEAARAGDSGKGFAVVASEVKNLANQTAKATDDIASQIAAMQEETTQAVGAIKGIGKTIGRINEIATSVSSAIEEQNTATYEISCNMSEASRGTQEVSGNIVNVTQAAEETGSVAADVLAASEKLSDESHSLNKEVDAFLAAVKAT